jgi:hypothetical protein
MFDKTEPEAIELLLENPLLIRRPLMQVGDSLMAGFDRQAVDNWIVTAFYGGQKSLPTLHAANYPSKLRS